MTRPLRRLFTLPAAVSAILCLGVCGMWARSVYRLDETPVRREPGRWWFVRSDRGRVALVATRPFPPPARQTPELMGWAAAALNNADLRRTDFGKDESYWLGPRN